MLKRWVHCTCGCPQPFVLRVVHPTPGRPHGDQLRAQDRNFILQQSTANAEHYRIVTKNFRLKMMVAEGRSLAGILRQWTYLVRHAHHNRTHANPTPRLHAPGFARSPRSENCP